MDESAITSLDWCDVELEGLAWEQDGRDLVLRIRQPGGGGKLRVVTCRWAEALKLDLAFEDGHGGHPLSWDGSITQIPDGRWTVAIDFASSGELRLCCSEIDVRIE